MKLVRLSALRTGRFLPRRKYSRYSFLLEAESTPGPQCGQKDLCQRKIPMTPSGIEPATFWLVAQCLNQLRHRVPPTKDNSVYHLSPYYLKIFFYLWPNTPTQASAASFLRFLACTHTHTHTVVPPWMSDQPVAKSATYTTNKKRNFMPSAGQSTQRSVYADQRRRLHSHRDRCGYFQILNDIWVILDLTTYSESYACFRSVKDSHSVYSTFCEIRRKLISSCRKKWVLNDMKYTDLQICLFSVRTQNFASLIKGRTQDKLRVWTVFICVQYWGKKYTFNTFVFVCIIH